MKTILGRLYLALLILLLLLPPFFWWRGGMWNHGELPTHGMQNATAGAGVALLLYILAKWLRSKQN
ncbi:MAG: hypothetical protein OQJ97_08865 [Rhodospirillales bacterium]|nr:hypothetical protein [Rhodospirillales bacterium]